MSFRNVVKDGWHPKGKDGGKESWRGDFKGINQVAGWIGKTRDPHKEEAAEHVSRPLSTLKDPALFGPPPKNVNYHGGAALPHEITPHTTGLGAPLTPEQTRAASRVARSSSQEVREREEEEAEEARRRGPPVPYRADRTGLKTDHLPPPPVHRDINRSPVGVDSQAPKPKPSLPPRLPSRQNTAASITPPPPTISPPPQHAPPAYDSIPMRQSSPQTASNNYGINQGAVNRLGNAGVSVPGLGIGSNASNTWQSQPHEPNAYTQSSSPNPQPPSNQLSELQSRFSRMNTNEATTRPFVTPVQSSPPVANSSQPTPSPTHQTQGTTWGDKQAAFRTAQNMHREPSTVSVSDARSAASTINSFRERHQDSITAASNKASSFNKKYNVTGRLNSFLEKHTSPTSEHPPATPVTTHTPSPQMQPQVPAQAPPAPAPLQHQAQIPPQPQSPHVVASIARKPPPPPPPKKPASMHGSVHAIAESGAGPTAPPPVPLGTKPTYS